MRKRIIVPFIFLIQAVLIKGQVEYDRAGMASLKVIERQRPAIPWPGPTGLPGTLLHRVDTALVDHDHDNRPVKPVFRFASCVKRIVGRVIDVDHGATDRRHNRRQ